MSNILRATKYQLMTFKPQSYLCLSIILLNIFISVTVTYLFTGSGVSAGSTDSIAIIWIFITGLLSFKRSFKFMLANAISRKTQFWANILSMAILSVTWAVTVALILSFISRMNIQVIVLYTLFYGQNMAMSAVIWFSAAFYLLIILGWLINMVYYRSSLRMAYAISFAPFVISGLLTMINQTTQGKLFDFMLKFIVTAMGFSGSVPNPYIASFSMLLLTVILCAFNYRLIRKAQIKE